MNIVILGLSITSSWGNGHATTFRGLVKALHARGHAVLFLERDVPWYADNRDLPHPPYCRTELYQTVTELRERFTPAVRDADLTIVGSYVPEGIAVGEWATQTAANGMTAFYDIDTPVTLAQMERGECAYLSPALVPRFDLYLSFSGGPALALLEHTWGARAACPFYCAVDPELYYPDAVPVQYDLGYLGTYSPDRQPTLNTLLLEPARRFPQGKFIVAGPQYPDIPWPPNVARREHLPPALHRAFYCAQKWTLNVTRADMIALGWSPSVRLFEAAACAVPILSDGWDGLSEFLTPGAEIVVGQSTEDALHALRDTPDSERRAIGERARTRVLHSHTAAHRAIELEHYVKETA